MTDFRKWALTWYDKNEKIESLKSNMLDEKEKSNIIKVIMKEVAYRLNLILDANLNTYLSGTVKQKIRISTLTFPSFIRSWTLTMQ